MAAETRTDRVMIVEMREYTLHPGKVPEYLKLYEHEGLEIQREILGRMVGYYSTEVGPSLNQVVHMWAYDSFEDRVQRRARLAANPSWQAYVQKIRPMLVEQRNRVLRPAPFFESELPR
ncbi:MAG: NIPSNAP family protein [Solirubrobacteraceae bacterium]